MEYTVEEFANLLEQEQAKENGGMGVQAVRDVVMYLRRGDLDGARGALISDGDKIRSYPHMDIMIRDFLEIEDITRFGRFIREAREAERVKRALGTFRCKR